MESVESDVGYLEVIQREASGSAGEEYMNWAERN